MKTAAIVLAAPLGYLFLTGYLLARIRPFPIAFMPEKSMNDTRREHAIAA